MEIKFFTQNNNIQKDNSNANVSFKARMTPQIMQKIQHSDIAEISKKLADKGIITDFKDNKIIAWCCEKTVEIFEVLNKKYKAGLSLPNEIHVENFENLKSNDNTGKIGACLLFPCKYKKNSDKIFKEKSVFFNSFEKEKILVKKEHKYIFDWNNIDKMSDVQYFERSSSSSHFLYIFMHEFSHAAHEDNLLKKIGAEDFEYFITEHLNDDYLYTFNDKYKKLASLTCDYAGTNPFETIACDLSRTIISKLDSDLEIKENPFKQSPYEKESKLCEYFFKKIELNPEKSYFQMIKNFWNGKID